MSSTIPHERTLRKIVLATLLPAFPLIVASGVMSSRGGGYDYRWGYWYHHSGPTIIFFALIPTFFSAFTSMLFLQTAEDPLAKRPHWRTGLWFLLDFFLGASNLAVLIPVWIFEPRNMNKRGNWMMLETYTTVFLISNLAIHAYLALYHPFKALRRSTRFPFNISAFRTECPHCHGSLRTVETVGGNRAGYSLLRAEEYLDEPEGEASEGIIQLPPDADEAATLIRQSTDSEVSKV